jgi:hypothetical protein
VLAGARRKRIAKFEFVGWCANSLAQETERLDRKKSLTLRARCRIECPGKSLTSERVTGTLSFIFEVVMGVANRFEPISPNICNRELPERYRLDGLTQTIT